MNEQQQQLDTLKIRVFDLSEALQQERDFKQSFFTELYQLIGLDESQANDPSAYITRVAELKALAAKAPAEEVQDEVQPVSE
ncbi:MAG: hypothetical protein ACRC3J_05425 [Culicoidibacterales bacterium]